MNNIYYKSTTIVIVGYKSREKILKFIEKIPENLKVIVVENSNDTKLKNIINEKYKNVEIYINKNDGVSTSVNYAAKKTKTEYFLQISPDINFDFKDLEIFNKEAIKLENNFAALGPQFLNVSKKSHKQTDPKIPVAEINSIHGSVMFINKKKFDLINGFDENFFLYFEETDYCKRARAKGLKSYQINNIKVENNGRSVLIEEKEETNMKNILVWHFIWSKFYYYKKHYGYIISLVFFIPVLIRILSRMLVNYITNNEIEYEKYKFRLNGLKTSICGKKSSLRPNI